MPSDYIYIGSTPCDEECAQVGQPDYLRQAREECNRFIELIRRTLGPEPEGAQLSVKSNPHDFGTYLDVVCYYDTDNKAAAQYAFRCEDEAPSRWDQPSTQRDGQDRVCDSCLTAAHDMGLPDRESQVAIMAEMGADVEDHLCDQIEDPSLGFQCLCACRRR